MARKCKICGGTADAGMKKIRNGVICPQCAARLPRGVQESMGKFTDATLRSVMKSVRPMSKVMRVWVSCEGLHICEHSLILNGMEYPVSALSSVGLRFHPSAPGRDPGTAEGIISLVLELRSPHMLIEETVSAKQTAVRYYISGMDIVYVFPSILESVIRCADAAARSGSACIKEAQEYFQAAQERWRQRQERERQEEERRKREQESRRKGQETGSRGNAGNTGKAAGRGMTPLESALHLFGLRQPFTKEELKRRRNQYLTSHHVHPDDGGTGDKFRKVQEAYDLLLKFAAD